MYKTLTLLIVIFVLFSCKNDQKSTSLTQKESLETPKTSENFGIVIHGGAGTILKENMSDSLETAYREKLKDICRRINL